MKTIYKAVLACCGLISIALVMWFKTPSLGNSNNTSFIVGMTGGYAPFVSTNAQGEYEGFDIDFAHALASQLGKKLELRDLGSMTSLMIALEQGSIDAIIWAISITQERLNKFALIHYQGEKQTTNPVIFWKNPPQSISKFADLKGMTVCVEPSSSQGSILAKYPDIIIMPTEKVDDALLNIKYGKANASLVEPAIAKKFHKKYPTMKIIDMPLDKEEYIQGIGIVIKKNNTMLIKSVTNAVETLKKNRFIKTLETKWGIE